MNTLFEPAEVLQMKRRGLPGSLTCPPAHCGHTQHQSCAPFGSGSTDVGGPPAPLMRGAWTRMADVEVLNLLGRLEGPASWPGADQCGLEVRTCTAGWRRPLGWTNADLFQLEFELGSRKACIDAVASGSRAWLMACGGGLPALRNLVPLGVQRLPAGHAARRHLAQVLRLACAARRDGLGPHRIVEGADDLGAVGVSPGKLLNRALRPVRWLDAPSGLRGQVVRLEAAVLHGGCLHRSVYRLSADASVVEESRSLVASDLAAPEHCVRCWRSGGAWAEASDSGLVVLPDMVDRHPQRLTCGAADQRQGPPAVKRCRKEVTMMGQ